MRVRLRVDFSIIAKDASRPTVSWLKFEPKVSNFPEAGQKVSKIEESTS